MLSQFDKVEKAINTTIQLEGGFSNHPNDRGGVTKYGITLTLYQKIVNPNATASDLQAISSNDARQFYKAQFFYKNKIEQLPEGIWDIVFDMCVNHGPKNAFSIMQMCFRRLGQKCSLDGATGPETIAAATTLAGTTQASLNALRMALMAERIGFYAAIIQRKPDQKVFASGWMSRAVYFLDQPVLP
jgi:lysozyme family protein